MINFKNVQTVFTKIIYPLKWNIPGTKLLMKNVSMIAYISALYLVIINIIIGWGFCDIQNSQGRGRGWVDYSWYHITELFYYTLNEKKTKQNWRLCLCFFIDGKQHKARELDMITQLRNHAQQSFMTWLPLTLSVLDLIIV